jgi:hypothetical protein
VLTNFYSSIVKEVLSGVELATTFLKEEMAGTLHYKNVNV